MAKETPIFDLPYPESTDAPNGAAQIQAAVEKVEELLAQIEALVLTEPGAGDIIIVSGTGDPVYKAVTGDVTLSTLGVTSIGNAKVLEAMLAGESVATAKIAALAVTAAKLAENAVQTAKIENLAVTEAKLAALAVTAGKLAAEAVETGKIKNAAVTTAKIAALAITEGLIADGAVTSRKSKLTADTVGATGATNIRETGYVTVTGTEKKLTVAVKSLVVVTAFFEFNIIDNHAPLEEGECFGRFNVDGVDGAQRAYLTFHPEGNSQRLVGTVGMTEVRELAAGEHTLKLRAKGVGIGTDAISVGTEGTEYTYWVTSA